jgi:hypothetical protein
LNIFAVKDAQTGVELVTFISCLVLGLSHLLQPQMWMEFFRTIIAKGKSGLILNGFLTLVPALVVTTLHQVWSGPALVITVFGWLLLIKSSIGFLAPDIGMRSLQLSRHGTKSFRAAGIGLLAVSGCAAAALWLNPASF